MGGGAYGADPVLGVVLGLLTALCYAGYLIIIRRGGHDLRRPAGPVAIATASTAVTATLIGLVVGDLDLLPGTGQPRLARPPRDHVAIGRAIS